MDRDGFMLLAMGSTSGTQRQHFHQRNRVALAYEHADFVQRFWLTRVAPTPMPARLPHEGVNGTGRMWFQFGAGRVMLEVRFMEVWVQAFGWEVWLCPRQFERVSLSRPDGVTWSWPKAGLYRTDPLGKGRAEAGAQPA